MTYEELILKQKEVVVAIEESKVYQVFSYETPDQFFIDTILAPKKPASKRAQAYNPLQAPIQAFVTANKEEMLVQYETRINDNKTLDMWKAGFGATVQLNLAGLKDIGSPFSKKNGETFTNATGQMSVQFRIFMSPSNWSK